MAVGDSNLFFNRDTKVYAVQATGTSTNNVWEIPVLNGYSFSQATNASQVTLNEMADATGKSRRGQRSFNDSLAPAEWSFDTYARPTIVGGVVRSPEEVLWHAMLAESNLTPAAALAAGLAVTSGTITSGTVTLTFTTPAPTGGVYFQVGDVITVTGVSAATGTTAASGTFTVVASTNSTVSYTPTTAVSGAVTVTTAKVVSATLATTSASADFFGASSNKTKLGTFDLYFVLGANKWNNTSGNTAHKYDASEVTTIYKIGGACVNEATVNFEIDGITTIGWSGMGLTVAEVAAIDFTSAGYTLIQNGTTSTTNMIRNRLTALTAVGVVPNNKTYSITLTGGSITISNNMNFLTPESIGVVNQPLGHVTGTRSVSGSFTCYLDELTNGSIDLYQDLLNATTTVTNQFQLQFYVGGKGATAGYPASPGVMFDMGYCHLEIPTVNIDDVIGVEVAFTALPSTISNTDELNKIRYVA